MQVKTVQMPQQRLSLSRGHKDTLYRVKQAGERRRISIRAALRFAAAAAAAYSLPHSLTHSLTRYRRLPQQTHSNVLTGSASGRTTVLCSHF